MRRYELIGVGFFSEVEVRGQGVLEEVSNKVSGQQQKGSVLLAYRKAGRDDFQRCGGQHEPCAQSDKILEIRTVPVLLNNNRATKNVCRGGGRAEQKAEKDRVHGSRKS